MKRTEILVNQLHADLIHNAVKRMGKLCVLVYLITWAVLLLVALNVLQILSVQLILLVKIKNALTLAQELVDALLNVQWSITVLFVHVLNNIQAILFPNVSQYVSKE